MVISHAPGLPFRLLYRDENTALWLRQVHGFSSLHRKQQAVRIYEWLVITAMLESCHCHGLQSREVETNGKCAGVRTVREDGPSKSNAVQVTIPQISAGFPSNALLLAMV
ncbi:hypothetical protein KIN20_032671 [Parelaphostrongylus tenuis]|uniref:Uncharacterized protein n=1 Tax=Parelaphostrongylus tenuis TaxID=148309 RepID=A0AAD5R7G5_PARTN|nr:hypothetical protein KIN20_032671 [Parelaphostrongylus tenuis]